MAYLSPEIIQKLRRIQISTTRMVNDVLAGAYHSAFKGLGMEFEDVREYQPGDEVRTIDWNVTARMNHPYVKSYREERELTVMLVVDVSASAHFGSNDSRKSELIAEIGAVLAFSAIKNNDKVGLILFSDQIELYLPPKKGTRHVLRVIRELLVFEPKGKGTDIGAALTFLGKVQKRKGVCFLISDFMNDHYTKEITITAKRHDLITLSITDPYEQNFPNMQLVMLRDLESGKLKLVDTSTAAIRQTFQSQARSRQQQHRTLMNKINAGSIELQTDQSYVSAIRNFFKIREKRR